MFTEENISVTIKIIDVQISFNSNYKFNGPTKKCDNFQIYTDFLKTDLCDILYSFLSNKHKILGYMRFKQKNI